MKNQPIWQSENPVEALQNSLGVYLARHVPTGVTAEGPVWSNEDITTMYANWCSERIREVCGAYPDNNVAVFLRCSVIFAILADVTEAMADHWEAIYESEE